MSPWTIEGMREDYDWKSACEEAKLDMTTLSNVVAADAGENDEAEWIAVFETTRGTFVFLAAGCDYTGWDCRASGDYWERDDLETLILNDISEEQRARLDLVREVVTA